AERQSPAPAGRPSSTLVGSVDDRRLHVDHIVRTTLARRGAGVCPEAAEFPRRERDARLKLGNADADVAGGSVRIGAACQAEASDGIRGWRIAVGVDLKPEARALPVLQTVVADVECIEAGREGAAKGTSASREPAAAKHLLDSVDFVSDLNLSKGLRLRVNQDRAHGPYLRQCRHRAAGVAYRCTGHPAALVAQR